MGEGGAQITTNRELGQCEEGLTTKSQRHKIGYLFCCCNDSKMCLCAFVVKSPSHSSDHFARGTVETQQSKETSGSEERDKTLAHERREVR